MDVKILPGPITTIGSTRAEAERRFSDQNALLPPGHDLERLSRQCSARTAGPTIRWTNRYRASPGRSPIRRNSVHHRDSGNRSCEVIESRELTLRQAVREFFFARGRPPRHRRVTGRRRRHHRAVVPGRRGRRIQPDARCVPPMVWRSSSRRGGAAAAASAACSCTGARLSRHCAEIHRPCSCLVVSRPRRGPGLPKVDTRGYPRSPSPPAASWRRGLRDRRGPARLWLTGVCHRTNGDRSGGGRHAAPLDHRTTQPWPRCSSASASRRAGWTFSGQQRRGGPRRPGQPETLLWEKPIELADVLMGLRSAYVASCVVPRRCCWPVNVA